MGEAWIVWDGEAPVDVKATEELAREAAHVYLTSTGRYGQVHIQGPIAPPSGKKDTGR